MRTLIENTIQWDKIGEHPKDSYIYSIEKAVVLKETAVLSVDIKLNFIIPFSDIDCITKTILKAVPGLKEVSLNFIYENVILSEFEIIKHYIEHMIYKINGSHAAVTKTIFPKEFTYENGKLTIKALGDMAVKELNSKVAQKFEMYLRQDFGLEVKVEFINNEDSYIEIARKKNELSKRTS